MSSSPTEEILVKACKSNNSIAQRQLYELYIKDVLKVGLRYLDNKSDIEDIAQISFEKVFTKIQQFQITGSGSLKAWITKIVVNECLQFIRKNHQQKIIFIEDDSQFEHIDDTDETFSTNSHEIKEVLKCIQALPLGYKTVLNLYVFENMKHEAIAETLGISINTSKSQLSRARQLLQNNLKKLKQ